MFKTLFGLILFICSFSQAQAANSCLDAARVKVEVFSQFQIITQDQNLKYDNCSDKNILRKFAEAILFLKDVPVVLGPADVDLGILGTNPFGFFKDRVSTVVFDAKNNVRCGNLVMAYVLRDEESTLHICPHINQFDAFTMSGTLVHEARHIGGGFSHARCKHGLMAVTGSAACDPDFQNYKGSYAVGTEYEIKISYSSHVSDLLRQQARARAVVGLLERYNELPLGMKTGALLQTTQGSVLFYDGEEATEIMQVPQDSILTTRNSLPTFFDRVSAQVESYIFGGTFISAAGEYADNFRRLYSDDERANLLDVSYTGDYSCLLFHHKIRCGADADPDVEISLENIDPVQFLSSPDSALVQNNALNIVTRDGGIYNLPVFWKDLRTMQASALRRDPLVRDLVSLGPWKEDQEIAITQKGQVVLYSDSTKSWKRVEGLPAKSFQKLMAPYYWSPRLEQF